MVIAIGSKFNDRYLLKLRLYFVSRSPRTFFRTRMVRNLVDTVSPGLDVGLSRWLGSNSLEN